MPKTLFIDSTPDIDSVWKKVHGPSDVPIAVNMAPVAADDIPRRIEGYDTVINDATYFNEETLKRRKATFGPDQCDGAHPLFLCPLDRSDDVRRTAAHAQGQHQITVVLPR